MRLHSSEPPLPGARVARLSSRGRDDYFAVDASGAGSRGVLVSIVLHVVQGVVHELEVLADGEKALASAEVTDLTDPVVG